MLGSLMLGLDARRVVGEHQGITEWYKMGELRKNGSSNFTVDLNFIKKFQERKLSNKTLDRYEIYKI